MKALYIGKPISDSGGGYLSMNNRVVVLDEIPPNSDNKRLIRVRKEEGKATHMVFPKELEMVGEDNSQIS